jgi:hypothetical protein
MDNRIVELVVTDHRLDPAESEVRVAVYPEKLTSGTEVRGRLMGPGSPYTSTIEIAYHWREMSRTADHILLRSVIPEPCFWEPQSPYLYQGPLELWQDGQRIAQTHLSRGLRQVRLLPQELRVNGQTMTLRGTSRLPSSEAEARALHAQGMNLLLPSVPQDYFDVWGFADRFGFFVLARAFAPSVFLRWKQESHLYASALGWAFTPELLFDDLFAALPRKSDERSLARVGIELRDAPLQPLPARASFILCAQHVLPALADVALPKFVLAEAPLEPAPAGVVGYIAPV